MSGSRHLLPPAEERGRLASNGPLIELEAPPAAIAAGPDLDAESPLPSSGGVPGHSGEGGGYHESTQPRVVDSGADPDTEAAVALDPFDLVVKRRLGNGTFGDAYLVHHRDRPHVPLVVKVPRRGKLLPRSEAVILRNMHHSQIVRFRDLLEVPHTDQAFLVMEFCERGSLKDLLHHRTDAGQLLSAPETARILYDVLRALEYIHLKKIIHLDVK